jgi:hypothetical protein
MANVKNKYFEVSIPVFKKGDDMDHCVRNSPTIPDAFLMQAEAYAEAANVCRRMASFMLENPDCTFEQADTHIVLISGPEDKCAGLVSDGILYSDPFCDEDDEFDSSEEGFEYLDEDLEDEEY